MARTTVSFTTFNLLNLNEPGIRLYQDADGWTQDEYDRKIAWTARMLDVMRADVFGFQELWHARSLEVAAAKAGLAADYRLLVPEGHDGRMIVCAGAVRKDILIGEPSWISDFPPAFRLESKGDDAQADDIAVRLKTFSRPVLSFRIRPRADSSEINVFVCHFKSKAPTRIDGEAWYQANKPLHQPHTEALGSALSTIRRTAEAAAFRIILTNATKNTDLPVVVIGDINDGQHSNTLNVLTGQPHYLTTLTTGGGDTDLYSGQTLQQYRSETDVYYTHVYRDRRESLDHILFSQEFYDNSRKRIWAFDGLEIANDHLNRNDHKQTGTNDHGVVRVTFKHKPATPKRPRPSALTTLRETVSKRA